eukprot:TRINITY_DN2261_c0_g1_i3.p1 TRINITY_DN2261_c0_g1~~TRINITY_DN2261_c0_g1_i3.p1  ORF type:complete len:403 (-),score=105.63 TRINITY_DN2261_c0_g1_i3:46-1254(-)
MRSGRLVSRDLTPAWKRHRKAAARLPASSSTSRGGDGTGAGVYPGSEALLAEEGASNRADKSCLPPEWVDYADKAQEEIKDIKGQLVKLTKAHQRRLLSIVSDSAVPDKEVEAISGNVSSLIRCCEQSVHQIRASGKNRDGMLDDEFRQNMQRNLASQLQQLCRQFREAQKEFMAELKRRKASSSPNDLEAAHTGSGARALSSSAAPGGSSSLQQQQQQQLLLAEIDDMEVVAANRSAEIAQIVSSVEELNRIFKDLAALVIDQGTILDRIDFNTEKIYNKSNEAKGQILKAVKKKKESDTRAWKCFLVWGGLDAILLLVLLVKYQIKYGLLNVLIFVVIMSLVCTGLYYYIKWKMPKFLTEGPESLLPEGWRPSDLWKKLRPGPVNAAKMAVSMRGGGSPV